MPEPTYLGDAVYVKTNSYGQVVLFTHNGISELDTIYLEPEVIAKFQAWLKLKDK